MEVSGLKIERGLSQVLHHLYSEMRMTRENGGKIDTDIFKKIERSIFKIRCMVLENLSTGGQVGVGESSGPSKKEHRPGNELKGMERKG